MRKDIFKRFFFSFLTGTLLLGVFSCQSEYERMIKRELASGVRSDSLFFGMYFGMSSKDFYGRCWELNNQGILYHGAQNMTVEYRFDDFGKAATMNFYPEFYEDKIYEMPITFAYSAFAPWNPEYSPDSLLAQTLEFIEPWFGIGFIKISHPEKGDLLAKVEGNRRVLVFISEDKVKLLVTDLSVKDKADAKKGKTT